jgi:hypothetical protein
MKTSRNILQSLLITLLLCLPICAQVQSKDTRFSKNGLSFDYPSEMKLEDMSNDGGQHLVLAQGSGGAQIMVISRYDKINTADELAKARSEVADAFAETMQAELQKMDPKLTRTAAQVEVAGAQATGVRLRAVLNQDPGVAEMYSLLLGKRLVMVTLIGSDKEVAAAASAWSTIRRSLKVEERAAAAQVTAKPAPVSTAAPLGQPDMGTVTGQTYSNRYFGLALTIPQGLLVQDTRAKELINATGKQLLTSEDKNKQAELDAASAHTFNLLTLTKFPLETAVEFNPGFIIAAEKLPVTATEISSSTYLSEMKKVFQYSHVPVNMESDVRMETVGGLRMGALDISIQYPNGMVKQRYYAYVKKGYALGFILSYQTPEQLQSFVSMLQTLKL